MSFNPAADIFRPIFDASVLEDAVIATLRAWMPTYIQEIEFQRGWERGRIQAPRTYGSRNEFSTFPDEAMPIVVVVSPGLADAARPDGEGRYIGWWSLGVGIVARANDEENTNRIAKVYAACARAILLQKQGLDGSWAFGGVEWIDENFSDIPTAERERTIRSAQVIFRVWVDELVTRNAGPAHPAEPDPASQPGSDWPDVETADVTVNVVEEV
jgi:hypothetical protein